MCISIRAPKKKRQPIYVGKGMTESRLDQHWRRGSHNLVLQGVLDDIAEENLEPIIEYAGFFDREADAFKYEQGLIAKYGRRNIGTGTLCNLSAGDQRRSRAAKSGQELRLLDLHIRLPPQTVLRIDALIGERGFVGRSEATRAIIEAGLRSQP
jgi:hypothetical protein